MKTKLLVLLALAAMVVGMSVGAGATNIAPTLVLYDAGTGNSIVITDGAAGDSCAVSGCVTFSGSLGNFIVNVDTGQVAPPLATGNQDLSFVATNISGVTDTLYIWLSGQGYGAGVNINAIGTIGGTQGGTGNSVRWAAGIDTSNSACSASGCPVTSTLWDHTLTGNPFSSKQSVIFSSGPYSLDQAAILHLTSGNVTTGDFHLNVPEPASLTLLGAGFLGLLGLRRRKNG
ncbi:MAG: PEP-CTERM sorting domain-containing protein [Terriglobales bacterium]